MADPLLLLYRADWSQWSLSANVVRRSNRRLFPDLTERLAADMRRSGGMAAFMASALSASRRADAADEWSQTTQRLLLAPGGRYRFEPDLGQPAPERRIGQNDEDEDDEDQPRLIVSDGQSCWMIWEDEADQSVADRSRPPFSDIVRPTWLMQQLQLSTTGTTEVAGRAALQVRGTPRLPADRWGRFAAQLDHVDIAIDAEMGLVLRWETIFDGQPLSSLAVTDLLIDPSAAADPASFRPDEGIDVDEGGIGPPESNLAWRGGGRESDIRIDKLRMTLNVARGAGYLAARRLARPEPASVDAGAPRDDEDAEMPAAPPTPGPAPATPGSRRPVPDPVLHLITHTGMAPLTLTAQVHHWLDGMLAARSVPWLAPGDMHERPGATGFLGAQEDSLFRWRDSHQTARLTLAMPDRYRIDFDGEHRPRHPLTMACDGELLRKIYHNRVVSSPPLPLPTDFVRLVDPAWLLRDWPLSEAGEETVNGRRAIRLIAERPPVGAARGSSWSDHTALIALAIDADLGIVLQQVSYLDGKPVNRYELRDVQPCEAIDIAEFGRGVAPDLPEIHTSGAPIGDLDLPPAARAVGQATTELVNGARSAFGWLASQARKVGGS